MSVSRRTLALLLASAAVLSACTSGADQAASPDPAPKREQLTEPPVWDPGPSSLAAIGDSITTGFDACSILADCLKVSWATGTDPTVPSLAQQLNVAESWNHAQAGATMADLPDQARLAAAREPELLTVLVGANDACARAPEAMTEVADFRADFTEAVGVIRDSLPTAQIYVASIPDLRRLWSEGKEYSMARVAWRFGVCPSMLREPRAVTEEAEERRTAVHQRIGEFNAVLEEVCEADEYCRYDEGAVHAYPFSVDELSEWDWFHPSRLGQRALADLAYAAVTRE
jgi:lysophospholipase L1-like esterase